MSGKMESGHKKSSKL